MDYEKLMRKARRINAKRDKEEREVGFAAPGDGDDNSLFLRTAMSAIECGIKTDDWDCVAEGQAMLETLELRLRQQVDSDQATGAGTAAIPRNA